MTAYEPPTLDAQLAPGSARLHVELIAGRSAVTGAGARSPLRLLTPRPRGGSAWAYLSSFGGGLVAGDETRLDLRLGPGAACFVSTQASTKVYRNPERRPCSHRLDASLESGSLLVLAPDPVQSFAGSFYEQRQTIRMAEGAGLVLVDGLCSGRPARGERWAFSRYESRTEIWSHDAPPQRLDLAFKGPSPGLRSPSPHPDSPPSVLSDVEREGVRRAGHSAFRIPHSALPVPHSPHSAPRTPHFLDSLLLDPEDGPLDSPSRMGRFNCLALMVIIGEPLRTGADALLAAVSGEPVTRRSSLVISASPIRGGALLRLAGEHAAEVAQYLRRQLAFLPPLLGDDPWARKW